MILADSWTADTAQIVAARPDLVIASVPYQERAVAEILKAGARFLGLAPKTLADIYTDITTIAGAVGEGDRGQEVIAAMQRRIDGVKTMVDRAARPRAFCEEWGKPIIASQHWIAELVEAAGGEFIGSPGQSVSAEQILEQDPEARPRSFRCGLVRGGRSRSPRENRCRTRLAADVRGRIRACLLHLRRISEYSRAHIAAGAGCVGVGDPSGVIPAHERNPADYWSVRVRSPE